MYYFKIVQSYEEDEMDVRIAKPLFYGSLVTGYLAIAYVTTAEFVIRGVCKAALMQLPCVKRMNQKSQNRTSQ